MATILERAAPGKESGLKRLGFSQLQLEQGESTEKICHSMAEAVYLVTAGYGIFSMFSSGARFEYPVQQGMTMWLSDSAEHYLRNDGEGPLRCICVTIQVDNTVQERGKEVQRRIANFNELPLEFVDQGGTMKIAFRGSAMGSERIDTVEYLAAPPGGHKPEHYNQKIEGLIYFTRGRGRAAVQGALAEIKAGDLVLLPVGARREFEAARDAFLECFVLSVLV